MPEINLNGIEIHVSEQGQGQELVFVHGLGIDSTIFQEQVEYFKSDYRVICYDLRGHGKSDAPETGYSYQDYADELKNLIEYLSLNSFHLVGLSMGGAIAAKYIIENPGKAKSMTFVGSHITGFYKFKGWPNVYKIAQSEGIEKVREIWKKFRLFENVSIDSAKLSELEAMVDGFSCAPWLDPNFRYKDKSDLDRLDRIDIPTLVTIGKMDQDFYPVAEILRDNLPNCRFEEFDCGHLVAFEKPEELNVLLKEFLVNIY